jgi:hypothetical protein
VTTPVKDYHLRLSDFVTSPVSKSKKRGRRAGQGEIARGAVREKTPDSACELLAARKKVGKKQFGEAHSAKDEIMTPLKRRPANIRKRKGGADPFTIGPEFKTRKMKVLAFKDKEDTIPPDLKSCQPLAVTSLRLSSPEAPSYLEIDLPPAGSNAAAWLECLQRKQYDNATKHAAPQAGCSQASESSDDGWVPTAVNEAIQTTTKRKALPLIDYSSFLSDEPTAARAKPMTPLLESFDDSIALCPGYPPSQQNDALTAARGNRNLPIPELWKSCAVVNEQQGSEDPLRSRRGLVIAPVDTHLAQRKASTPRAGLCARPVAQHEFRLQDTNLGKLAPSPVGSQGVNLSPRPDGEDVFLGQADSMTSPTLNTTLSETMAALKRTTEGLPEFTQKGPSSFHRHTTNITPKQRLMDLLGKRPYNHKLNPFRGDRGEQNANQHLRDDVSGRDSRSRVPRVDTHHIPNYQFIPQETQSWSFVGTNAPVMGSGFQNTTPRTQIQLASPFAEPARRQNIEMQSPTNRRPPPNDSNSMNSTTQTNPYPSHTDENIIRSVFDFTASQQIPWSFPPIPRHQRTGLDE